MKRTSKLKLLSVMVGDSPFVIGDIISVYYHQASSDGRLTTDKVLDTGVGRTLIILGSIGLLQSSFNLKNRSN